MVKTITIMDDAYNLLNKMKSKDESFSDIIRKLAKKNTLDLRKWLGAIDGGEERAKEMKEIVKNTRKRISQGIRMRTRQAQ